MARISRIAACAGVLVMAASTVSRVSADLITNDTYLDSYAGGIFPPATVSVPANDDFNYGNTGGVKVVVSAGSTDFPGLSTVHTVFTLPQSFWTAIGSQKVTSATVTFVIRNNNSGVGVAGAGETVDLAPLTQGFVAGLGGTPDQTKGGGTENTAANPIGADWLTYDGTHAWTTLGGTYDANDIVSVADTATSTSLTWDITDLINDAGTSEDTRADIENDGLLLKLSNEALVQPSGSQQFISFYSSEGAVFSGLSSNAPVVNFTLAAPEPASFGMLAMGALALVSRRKRKGV